jgi:hypothetical protein
MKLFIDRNPDALRLENWLAPPTYEDAGCLYDGGWFLVSWDADAKGIVVLEGTPYSLPPIFEALVDKPGLPLCQLRIGINPSGPVCLRLTLAGSPSEPLSSTSIRVPLRELVDEIVVELGAFAAAATATKKYDPEAFRRALAEAVAPHPEPGKRLPDVFLASVADVYRYALKLGQPPVNAVAEAFNVSRSTAGRYVVRARRRGMLGEAITGKAGEREPRQARGKRAGKEK